MLDVSLLAVSSTNEVKPFFFNQGSGLPIFVGFIGWPKQFINQPAEQTIRNIGSTLGIANAIQNLQHALWDLAVLRKGECETHQCGCV